MNGQNSMNGLHPNHAFLVQFRSGFKPGSKQLSGRIEHVASGKTTNFVSIQDLPRALRRMLTELGDTDTEGQ